MKAAKLLALAMVAGLVLVASLGAGTASASSALCKVQESPYCKTENRYPSGTELKATATSIEIGDFIETHITCTGSELKSKLSAFSGTGYFEKWSLTGCETVNGVPCTSTERNITDAFAALAWTAADDGTLSVLANGETGWDINCGTGYDCTLIFEPELDINGGKPASIIASSEEMMIQSSSCMLGSKWSFGGRFSATYTLNVPNPAYVAKAENPPAPPSGVVLCDSAEQGAQGCAAANIYQKGTSIAAEASNVKIVTPISTITCNKSSLKAELTATSGETPALLLPLQMTAFSLQECNFPGVGSCEASTDSLGTGGIRWIESPSNGGWRGGVTWTLQCGGFFSCTLQIGDSKAGDSMVLTGGNPATLVMTEYELSRDGEACFEENSMSASYTLNSPKPVYVKRNE